MCCYARRSIGLLCCCIRSRFDHDIYFRAWLEIGLLAILVSNYVLNANLSVQIVRFVNPDLCLLWCAWKGGLDDFLNRATQPALLLAHRGTSNATPKFYVGLGLRVQQKYKMYGIAREPRKCTLCPVLVGRSRAAITRLQVRENLSGERAGITQ